VNDVDAAVADEAVTSITEAGGSAVSEVVPVGTSEAAQALVDRAVTEFGRLDVLVNNAGILRDATLWKMTDDDFDAVITTHLRGTFTCTRAAAVRMREQGDGGRIICVGSPTGQVGNFGQTNYAAAKAGIVGMVRTWAMELARAEITVNAVVPVAATAMTETIPFLKPYVDALKAGEPLPPFARQELGFGSPEDAAGVVAFLASDAAAGITGQAVGIGGDRLALWSHPSEVVVEFADGTGWSADAIAEAWPEQFAGSQQTVGQQFPEPPK
jgi:NAD(P)-dependent dehydrogenase (short-subunit alcohol dehydrogenase family)